MPLSRCLSFFMSLLRAAYGAWSNVFIKSPLGGLDFLFRLWWVGSLVFPPTRSLSPWQLRSKWSPRCYNLSQWQGSNQPPRQEQSRFLSGRTWVPGRALTWQWWLIPLVLLAGWCPADDCDWPSESSFWLFVIYLCVSVTHQRAAMRRLKSHSQPCILFPSATAAGLESLL